MIVSLDEVKKWLRIDFDDDDELLVVMIGAAEEYLKEATGKTFDGASYRAKIVCMTLITEWYENRELMGEVSEQMRPIIKGLIQQLEYGGDTA